MKNLDKLQEDILDILNYSKEFIDESTCKDDIIQTIMYQYNCDGSFTYSTIRARESLSRYIDNYPYLIGDIVKYYHDTMGMEIGSEFFNYPEIFQVKILIEIIAAVLNNDTEFSEWMYDGSVCDSNQYIALIDNIIDNIIDGELDLNDLEF